MLPCRLPSKTPRRCRWLMFLMVLASAGPSSAVPIERGIVRDVRSIPVQPVAGQHAVLRLTITSCYRWMPGWSVNVTVPQPGIVNVNVSTDIEAQLCAGGQIFTRDIPYAAPEAGQYLITVTGHGLYLTGSSVTPSVPFVLDPPPPRPLTVLGGGLPAVVPVPVMGPLAIGLLGGVLALGGWFALRRRRA